MNKKRSDPVPLPWSTPAFKEIWEEWLAYRAEKGKKPYVARGLTRTFNALQRQSGNDEAVAIQMIDHAMSLNWEGIHPLKNNYGNRDQGAAGGTAPAGEARINALAQWGLGTRRK